MLLQHQNKHHNMKNKQPISQRAVKLSWQHSYISISMMNYYKPS